MLKALKRVTYAVVLKYFNHATLVKGVLKDTTLSLQCLFVGNSVMKYLLPKMYEGSPIVIKKWWMWLPSFKKFILNPPKGLDICIATLPLMYDTVFNGLFNFKGQEYVRQIIDTSGKWEEIRGRFHKNKRQTTNSLPTRYGLNYRISHDQKVFDFFYYRMFVPHIKKQFGDNANIDSYIEMKQYFLKGFLLLIISANQPVAGALCLIEDNVLVFRRTGVLDGDDRYIKCGAQMALYYFLLLYAKENNLKKVDAMKSHSFISDGVYRTKREWGAAVYPDNESKSWVYYFILNNSQKAVDFFSANPVIIDTENGLAGLIGWKGGSELSADDVKELTKRFYAQGLENLILLTPYSKIPINISL